ncbi:hypothetical protein HN011_003725 [Eciton burchellii]|nr:hypothetical protein HN011_003725 [Eciton burchellii]
MNSPLSLILLIGCYLYFIYSFGPKYMEKRQPFKVDRLVQIYDFLQIILSLVIFVEAVQFWSKHYILGCEPVDYSNTPKAIRVAKYVWLFFIIKVFDLMDTILFVLRKKQKQVTFLHVYHHVGMLIGCWCCAKFFPGGHITFLGLINSFVHVIMYLYYLLSSMKINLNYWKKYLTQMQIVQFFLVLMHHVYLLYIECDSLSWLPYITIPQNFFLTSLFIDFYFKSYQGKNDKRVLKKNEISDITTNIEKPKKQ